MNAEIRAFELSIRKFIEESDIPLEAKYLVLMLLAKEAKDIADAAVIAEYHAKEKAEVEGVLNGDEQNI